MIFQIFHVNSHYRNSHFQGNRENHPGYDFCDFPSKMKILKFLGNQPRHRTVLLERLGYVALIFSPIWNN